MGEHTPTPWTANPDGWQPWPGAIQIVGADGYVVAYTATGGPEKENADLLCKAASSHDAMVKALHEIATGCDDEHLHPFNSVWAELIKSRAREALAKVSA